MEIGNKGLDLIKSFEGCKLKVYLDIVGLKTVGYGHRTNLNVGTEITQEEANNLLVQDLTKFEEGVNKYVQVDLNQNQFDALVSFSYNLGLGTLEHSTLLKDLNNNDFDKAAEQFLVWDHAGGKVVPGLLRRRQAEKDLFLS